MNQTISSEQIKAARAWIDWTRDALALEAGVSTATIRNLENGKISARSAEPVRQALESKGFKFHGKHGISRHPDETRIYEGANSRDEFYEDLLTTVQHKGGDVGAIFKNLEFMIHTLGIVGETKLDRLE